MSYATTVVILLKAENVIKIVENQMKIQRLSINMLNKWSVAQFQVKLKLSWVYSLQRSAWNKIEAFKSFRCCWSVVGMEVGIKKKKIGNRKSEVGRWKSKVGRPSSPFVLVQSNPSVFSAAYMKFEAWLYLLMTINKYVADRKLN